MGRPGEGGGMACRRRSRQVAGHPRGGPVTACESECLARQKPAAGHHMWRRGLGGRRIRMQSLRCALPAPQRFLNEYQWHPRMDEGRHQSGVLLRPHRWKWQNGEIPRRPLLFFTIPVIPREANRAAMLQIRLGSCHTRIMHLVSYFAA